MKNVLFATTALVAFAGAAAAEVTVTGSAEIGVIGGTRYGDVNQFHTDIDVTFAMTGEADNGLTFGASVDLDEASSDLSDTDADGQFDTVVGPFNADDDNGATWFVAYGNARLDMGDTDGGFDWALTEVALAGGTIDDAETEHPGYNGNSGFDGTYGGQVARFTYTFGDFGAAMSAEIDDTGTFDPVWGLGVKYSGNLGGTTLDVGLGYQSRDDQAKTVADEILGLSVKAGLASGVSFAVNYSEGSGLAETVKHTGVGVGYEMNALAVGLNYGKYENVSGVKGDESTGYGLAVAYDLGGGLAVQFGYGNGETKTGGVTTDYDNYSLGLAMSF